MYLHIKLHHHYYSLMLCLPLPKSLLIRIFCHGLSCPQRIRGLRAAGLICDCLPVFSLISVIALVQIYLNDYLDEIFTSSALKSNWCSNFFTPRICWNMSYSCSLLRIHSAFKLCCCAREGLFESSSPGMPDRRQTFKRMFDQIFEKDSLKRNGINRIKNWNAFERLIKMAYLKSLV